MQNVNAVIEDLTPYERWMVRSNLQTIEDGEMKAGELVALLKSRGYNRVATAVEAINNDCSLAVFVALQIL